MLERETTWKLDIFVGFLWVLWVLIVTSLQLPDWLNLTGFSWLLLFGAARWSWIQAAIFLLILGWIFHGLSLTPSGVFWLSGIIVFSILKIAQLRIMVRNALQFAGSVFLTSLLYSGIQLFLIFKIYPEQAWSWMLLVFLMSSAAAQAIVGFFIYVIFVKLASKK
ncbi:MAG: hypothetical protein ACO3LE_03410 [Bdellovibrionota bacterium]|jgi:hypothetical protein